MRSLIRIDSTLACLALAAAVTAGACGKDKSTASAVDNSCTPVTGPAPAAAAADPNTTKMYAKYTNNGADESAFVKIRDSIVANSVAAPTASIGESFANLAAGKGEDLTTFKTNLADLLLKVYGSPTAVYSGRTMAESHAGLKITSAQYDYFITNAVVPALKSNGVMDADLPAFAAPVTDPAFKATIVTCAN